jgi:hypothetical protein
MTSALTSLEGAILIEDETNHPSTSQATASRAGDNTTQKDELTHYDGPEAAPDSNRG